MLRPNAPVPANKAQALARLAEPATAASRSVAGWWFVEMVRSTDRV